MIMKNSPYHPPDSDGTYVVPVMWKARRGVGVERR